MVDHAEPSLPSARDIPLAGRHLWEWFLELSSGRTQGFAPNPVTYPEIVAWAALTEACPEPDEVRALVAMDRELLDAMAEQRRHGEGVAEPGTASRPMTPKLFMGLFGKR